MTHQKSDDPSKTEQPEILDDSDLDGAAVGFGFVIRP